MEDFGIQMEQGSIVVIALVAVAYILVISLFGGYFSRFNKDINDFFYSGHRFSWWLPAASMVATGIGSYSFLKYSEQGFNTGMSSTMVYLNDWFLAPFFIFGWLPLIYYGRIKSVPEYFEKRFNTVARYISLIILLAYLLFYIGYNLYTIGVALEGMFSVSMIYSVPLLAAFLATYVTFGGQTAVIFTDLFQGIMLYLAGILAIGSGIYALGGVQEWWGHLPVSHRLPFVHLSENSKFNTAGLFWGEALAGSMAFSFLNQGVFMRYLTVKSVNEGRKTAFFNVMVTLPLSAIIVGAVGWIGKSILVKQGLISGPLPGYQWVEIQNTFHTFIVVCWNTVQQNSLIFGFVVSALIAALMSTIDTFINATAAIGIYDLYKPLIRPHASDRHYLKVARWACVLTTLLGLIMVIWFSQQKGSLMSIHYKGVMTIIPSIVTTLFMGLFWKRFNSQGACCSMILGSLLTLLTVWYPQLIDGLAWFLSNSTRGEYIYFRALFGMISTALIGASVTLLTTWGKSEWKTSWTVYGIKEAMTQFKGGIKPNLKEGQKFRASHVQKKSHIPPGWVHLPPSALFTLKANKGDQVYLSDSRWWLGGLRSGHFKAQADPQLKENEVGLSNEDFQKAYLLDGKSLLVEKII